MSVYNLSDRKLIWNYFKSMSRSELVTAIIQLLDEDQLNKLLKHLKEVKKNEKISTVISATHGEP